MASKKVIGRNDDYGCQAVAELMAVHHVAGGAESAT